MNDWFSAVSDPRDTELTAYTHTTLIWTALLMYLCRLGARRQIRYRFDTPEVVMRLGALSGQSVKAVPHGDTVANYLSTVTPDELQRVQIMAIRHLLETRRLENFRLLGTHYLLVMDMTGHLCFGTTESAFTEGCLTQTTPDGATLYYRPVCEAKLVTRTGLALSMGSEFVENEPRRHRSDADYKQDCELKAAQRLSGRVKEAFPGFSFCAVLDALYCNETGFCLCEKNEWHFIITLQDGSLPSVMEEFHALRRQTPEQRHALTVNDTHFTYTWVNDIPYGNRLLNVLECCQSDPTGKTKTFVWVTDIRITPKNCHALASEGGRQRWHAENEGFRSQKHGGFEMEHAYAKHPQSAKNFYLILQIAHLLSQFFECFCKGKRAVKRTYGSLRNLGHLLLESLRRDPPPEPGLLEEFLNRPIQVRLDTS